MSSTIGDHGPLTRAAARDLAATLRQTVGLRRVAETGVVQAIQRDSTNLPISASIRVGDVDYESIPLSGLAVRVGDAVRMSRDLGSPAGPSWRLDGYESSLSPFPTMDDSADIPPPTWGSPSLATTANTPGPGGQTTLVTARLRETPDRYRTERMEVQWATDADAAANRWAATMIGNVLGQDAEQVVTLPAAFPSATTINVRARTYTASGSRSVWGSTLSIVTASDTTTPSAPPWISVDTTTALQALITFPNPSQPLVFLYWEISIATSSGGAGAASNLARSQQYIHQVIAPTTIYVRIREVTRSGVAGAWFPAASWQGPYTLAAQDSYVDLVPPSTPSIASLVQATELLQGVLGVNLTTTLNAYTPPADFANFEYRYGIGSEYGFYTSTQTTHKVYNARQGVTYSVQVRAWDINGNASPYSSAATVVTPTVQTPPTPGSAPTVLPVYRGNVLTWAATPSSTTNGQIIAYEVQASTDNLAWTTIATVDATRWVDAARPAGQLLYYRYRPINSQGTAAAGFSPVASGTTLLVETGSIAANAVEANTIAANAVTSAKIAAGSITADKLSASVILASQELGTTATGRITGGGGNLLLDDLGVTVNGANGVVRFTKQAASDYTAMRNAGNLYGSLQVVDNWRNYPGRGMVAYVATSGTNDVDSSALYVEAQYFGLSRYYAAKITGRELSFIDSDNTIGNRRYRYTGDAIINGAGDNAYPLAIGNDIWFSGGWNTSSSGVDSAYNVGDLNLSTLARAVVLRFTFNVAPGINVYIHGGGSFAPERGIYGQGTGASVTISGIVPTTNGSPRQILLRSVGGTVSGTLIVLGYFQ